MISVILPVYNGGKFLKATISSLLNQTEKELELVIVNDGSTDNSEEVILSFNDKRIKYFKQENKGVAEAFNKGLSEAEGDFITFHGADDISLPHRFESSLRVLNISDMGFVHADMLLITENGSPFGYWQSANILPENLYSFFLNVGTPFNNPTMVFKREALKNEIMYDPTIKVGSDTDFILKALKSDSLSYHIPEPLYLYRRHQTNVTNQKNYDVLSRHVKLNITDEDLRNIPEANWSPDGSGHNLFAAKLIAGIGLSRRWMMNEAFILFNRAIPLIKSDRDRVFYEGMKGLIERDYQRAVKHFSKIENRNHLEENYLGEALLFLKKYNEAYSHFIKALEIYPMYHSPVQNLKAIGMIKGLNVLDKQMNKYK
ncbi:glycosyltransferase [Bacillus sp. JJ1609]|uniref:glycosyltransferase n=1 Tax=Bacillus sp. JJ1609 TaxID=3122977 RepID=UPI0030000DA7